MLFDKIVNVGLRLLGINGNNDADYKTPPPQREESLPKGRTAAEQAYNDMKARQAFILAGRSLEEDENVKPVAQKAKSAPQIPVSQDTSLKVGQEVQKKWAVYSANVGKNSAEDYSRLVEIKGLVAGFSGGDVAKPHLIPEEGFKKLGLRKDQFLSGLSDAAENTLVQGLTQSGQSKPIAVKFDNQEKMRIYYERDDIDDRVYKADITLKEKRFADVENIDPSKLRDTRYAWADSKNGLANARNAICARASQCHLLESAGEEKKLLAQELGYKYARDLKLWGKGASANEVEDAMKFLEMHAIGEGKPNPAIDDLLKKHRQLPRDEFYAYAEKWIKSFDDNKINVALGELDDGVDGDSFVTGLDNAVQNAIKSTKGRARRW
jgi:hypothetical protein